jgi:hypothetical protein
MKVMMMEFRRAGKRVEYGKPSLGVRELKYFFASFLSSLLHKDETDRQISPVILFVCLKLNEIAEQN